MCFLCISLISRIHFFFLMIEDVLFKGEKSLHVEINVMKNKVDAKYRFAVTTESIGYCRNART